jgi:hypothetical protein
MISRQSRQSRRLIAVGVASLVAVAVGSAYLVGRARASGAPATQPLTYSGILTDTAGTPLTGSKNIQVQIWDKDTAGTIVCTTGSAAQALVAGSFSIVLPAACVTAVRANPDLWTEVLVDGASAGRTKMGAVPYALEADSASNAGGALATRLAAIEAGNFGAHDTTGAPLRICSGSTPVATTAWQVYGTGPQIFITIDTSACKFTKRPLYLPVLAGSSGHWTTTGGSNPYTVDATAATQFQVYVYNGTAGTTPAAANASNWHIEWIAIGN